MLGANVHDPLLLPHPTPGFEPSTNSYWEHLLHADEEGVDEVPGGIGIQGALVPFHLPGYEVLQPLYLLVGTLLGSWQVLHH